ncbi:hypothetical protein [Pseudofrankia asymbiotica]|uniref:Uncharacterized protein n=1 Tax=Pseudofrankia asymbiotica TaxID=1834516 RepID=A0A1V2I2K5_9ACTN|nr:hypothetical protein [Pseudofrankia asymbiotica]ONH22847.1 hypothetical protein BL253_34645 [Pseudofrankia asymbiotica]
MDGFTRPLADGCITTVIEIVDDYSLLLAACHAATSENARDVWDAFTCDVVVSDGLVTVTRSVPVEYRFAVVGRVIVSDRDRADGGAVGCFGDLDSR